MEWRCRIPERNQLEILVFHRKKATKMNCQTIKEQFDERLDGRLSAAQQAVNELLARKEEMTQQLTELRVSVGGIEHKRRAIESQREPIAARVRDLRERMQTCAGEITGYTAKTGQFRAEIAGHQRQHQCRRDPAGQQPRVDCRRRRPARLQRRFR